MRNSPGWNSPELWPSGLLKARLVKAGLGLLFPPTCPLCSVELDESAICSSCERALLHPIERLCPTCGHEIPSERYGNKVTCIQCRRMHCHFDQAITLGPYAGPLRAAIVRMKHPGEQCLSYEIARLLAQRVRFRLQDRPPDVLIPVPMHWQRRLLRGNSSAQLLCDGLSRFLGCPSFPTALRCLRNARKQSLLSPRDRAENIKGIYETPQPARIAGAHVGLVDDTMTTGATVNEIAATLKRAGVSSVTVLVAARAMSN